MQAKLNNQQVQAIRETGRLFSDATILMHEAIAQKAGLNSADHKYLGLLIRNGAMTAGEFSKLTGLTTGAITGLMDRLEKKKLAKRQFDKADRRKIIIVPNQENALKLLGPIFNKVQEKMLRLLATLSTSEMEIIEKYMRSATLIMEEVIDELKNK